MKRLVRQWRLHVHPQDSSKAAYVNRKGEVKWNLQEIEVPTVEQSVREDALEVQDIRELGGAWDGLGLLMTFVLFLPSLARDGASLALLRRTCHPD